MAKTTIKGILESKTFWYGMTVIAGSMVDALANGLSWRQALIAGIGAGIVVLRMWTEEPVRLKRR